MSGWSSAFPIDEASQVGEARRAVAHLAEEIGFDDTRRGQAAIVVTELGNNLLRHAGSGEIVIRALGELPGSGIEILSLDKGPGMSDVTQCLSDGFSTSSSMGAGLGGVRRMSSQFDIYSHPGDGTVVMSRIHGRLNDGEIAHSGGNSPFEIGAVCRAMPGERVSGDGYHVQQGDDKLLVAIIDALGHGPVAFTATKEALDVCRDDRLDSPALLLETVHGRLRATRGAVMGVASLDLKRNEVTYAGIGNIAGAIYNGDASTHMVSMNGTVGQIARPPREFVYPWSRTSVMVLTSDGIHTRFKLPPPNVVTQRHTAVIAALIYRDWQRRRDDATVFVVREKG